VEAQEIKASRSSLVAGIEMDTVLEHSVRGKEKLRGEGSLSSGSVVEIQEEKMPEHAGGANEELMDGSEQALRSEKGNCSSWVVEMEKLLEDTSPSVEMARWNQRYIHRVPECIKKTTNRVTEMPTSRSLYRWAPCTTASPTSCPWRSTRGGRCCTWLTGSGSL